MGVDTFVNVAHNVRNAVAARRADESRHTEANVADPLSSGTETRLGDSSVASGYSSHSAGETRRSSSASESGGYGTCHDQVKGGSSTTGRTARLRMGALSVGHRPE